MPHKGDRMRLHFAIAMLDVLRSGGADDYGH